MAAVERLIFLDVDGVLNPDLRGLPGFTARRLYPAGYDRSFMVRLNPEHGVWLTRLAEQTGGRLVWGTTWSENANPLISPHVGLPTDLDWVNIPQRPRWGLDAVVSVGEWKTRRILKWAGDRPFVWFDDEPDIPKLVAAVDDGVPRHVVYVDPEHGLTPDHVEEARDWLTRCAA